MDVLKERTGFIGRFYQTAAEPFRETMRKIEMHEAPFDFNPFYEYEEPPFLEEWLEADTALQLLGLTCLSMLSESLKLYFHTWEKELGIRWSTQAERTKTFESGFLHGYRRCFEAILKVPWNNCPADLTFLEQITLARNRSQHPDDIWTMRIRHSYRDRKQHKTLFFISEAERRMYESIGDIPWINPAMHVSPDMLVTAIEQVERLAEWLEKHIQHARWGATQEAEPNGPPGAGHQPQA